jgi:hypothetical protein
MRGSQATPVDPGQAELARGCLMCRDKMLLSHRRACPDGLEDEILRPARLHHLVVPNGTSSFDINGYVWVHTTPQYDAYLDSQRIPYEVARHGFQQALDAHNSEETPYFATSIENKALKKSK